MKGRGWNEIYIPTIGSVSKGSLTRNMGVRIMRFAMHFDSLLAEGRRGRWWRRRQDRGEHIVLDAKVGGQVLPLLLLLFLLLLLLLGQLWQGGQLKAKEGCQVFS